MLVSQEDVMRSVSSLNALAFRTAIGKFLEKHPKACAVVAGLLAFELQRDHCSIEVNGRHCILHLWSSEQNLVRRVQSVTTSRDTLQIKTLRFGGKTEAITLIENIEAFHAGSRKYGRESYPLALEGLLRRKWSGRVISRFVSTCDRSHGLSGLYCRGTLIENGHKWAVISTHSAQSALTIDRILTQGILWLDRCRQVHDSRQAIKGLQVIVPAGCSEGTRDRMTWLDVSRTCWRLWEADLTKNTVIEVDLVSVPPRPCHIYPVGCGTVSKRLQGSLDLLLDLVPSRAIDDIELHPTSDLSFAISYRGLVFADLSLTMEGFTYKPLLTFGVGKVKTVLAEHNRKLLSRLIGRLITNRAEREGGRSSIFRAKPDDWLKATLSSNTSMVVPGLKKEDRSWCGTKLFHGSSTDLILTGTDGRVIALKATTKESVHLPVQGLDLLHRLSNRCEHKPSKASFPISSIEKPNLTIRGNAKPILYLVVPWLWLHPRTELILQYFSSAVEWQIVAINEAWRKAPRVIFRKHSGQKKDLWKAFTHQTLPTRTSDCPTQGTSKEAYA